MWPLYSDVKRTETERIQVKAEVTHWGDGAERGYFKAFRSDWRRIHDNALRVIPEEEQQHETQRKVAMEKIHDGANAIREHLMAAENSTWESSDWRVPSVWDTWRIAKLASEPVHGTKVAVDESSSIEVMQVTRIGRIDGVVMVDRLDREDVQTAIVRLQNDGAQLVRRFAERATDPPECPFFSLEMIRHPGPLEDEHDQSSELSVEDQHLTGAQPVSTTPRMMDRPWLRRTSVTAWSKLQEQAQNVFSTIMNDSTKVIARIQVDSTPDLRVLADLLEEHSDGESVEAGDARLGHGDNGCRSSAPQNEVALLHECSSTRACPRYIKFDGVFQPRVARTSLPQLVSSMLKSIVKKNASLLLTSAVPNTLTNDIGELLRRSSRATPAFEIIQEPSRDGLRLVTLPSELISADASRVDSARAAVGALADRVFKTMRSPTISLTNLALTLPSVWRDSGVLAQVEAQRTAVLAVLPVAKEHEPSPPSPAREDTQIVLAPGDARLSLAIPRKAPENSDGLGVRVENEMRVEATPANNSAPASASMDLPIGQQTRKQVTFKPQETVSTDDLVTSFLGGDSDQDDAALASTKTLSKSSGDCSVTAPSDTSFAMAIDQLARPAVWFLVRVKMLKVKPMAMIEALKAIPLDVLASVIFQLQSKLKVVVSHTRNLPQEEILETCFAFRHAVWLHSLRLLVEFDDCSSCSKVVITSRILVSRVYQSAVGKTQFKALSTLHVSMGGSPVVVALDEVKPDLDFSTVDEPSTKRKRGSVVQQESMPVRLICAIHLLEQDELLEELSDLGVSVIERELPPSIDMIVDEHNAIVLLTDQHFAEEKVMKVLTYELATAQVQFRKLWVLLRAQETEETLHLFFAALTNFTIEVQTFVCYDDLDASQVIRGIVDTCAEEALSRYRVLPRMWFARPFMLEEESQLERFLSSTRIMNAFAAQSVLHRLSFEELTSKSADDLKVMIGASLTSGQLALLWKMLHSRHGIDNGESMRS